MWREMFCFVIIREEEELHFSKRTRAGLQSALVLFKFMAGRLPAIISAGKGTVQPYAGLYQIRKHTVR